MTNDSPFTNQVPAQQLMRIPIAHGEGCYFVDPSTLNQLKAKKQILWTYVNDKGEPTELSNPNGSVENVAGVCNEARNVAGLMPHPERASEGILGCTDGVLIFKSMIHTLQQRVAA
ncbi:Phosphoribosylformylglycinamidine synthase subunit PurQ [bioreactor metagenome]|uniref:Phosphoribosylformylglycinamidine synthase subunit PurQ n=1 Tax=bioreactor metagenome TaxID=1076179 RepID=A0A645I5W2_9ZZZZ